MQTKSNEKVIFDIEKLKKRDPQEVSRIAEKYAEKKLTSKQVGYIAYHAKDALDVIQAIAKEISKSQENALKGNAYSNANAYTFSAGARQDSKTSEEKRDSYRHSENINKDTIASNERMNTDNNSVWKTGILALGVVASIYMYLKSDNASNSPN